MVLPCIMGVVNSIGGSCFGSVVERIKTEFGHLIGYSDNVESLRNQVQNLSDATKSVKGRIEAENSRGASRVDDVVDRLLKRMASLEEKASKIISDEEREEDTRCLMGLRPNLWACYLASKSARKAVDDAVNLLEEEKKLVRPVAGIDYSRCLGVTPIPDFEVFESRASVSNQIVAALKDPSVNMVGVYGMSGAGKTTLAEKIGSDLQLNGTFIYVVMIVVSEKQNQLENKYALDLINIQNQIAGGLKIQLEGQNLKARAAELHRQLEKKDKLLIILDDVWSRFELKDVGIHVGGFHKNIKILMTSRSEGVLLEMDSTNNFRLDSLPSADAWNLFDKMVTGDRDYSSWLPTAEQVVLHCGGIPILLVTIARALRNKDRKTWEDALTQLKQFDGEDINEEAYKRIEVSYKLLKNEKIKELFLLCAQLDHRSILFQDLLKYAMGLDLFKRCRNLKEVSGRLHKYLQDLNGCCLLQDGKKEGTTVKMHDVVHKFAVFVARRDHDMFIATDDESQEWPSKDELEHLSAISLPYCHPPPKHELPTAFDNPKLKSFILLRSEDDAYVRILDDYFIGMKGLKLMNLTQVHLSPVLLSSFSVLVNLRTLCLDNCELSDIAMIGELPMLQALSVVGSSIVCIPKEIGKLGRSLKLLDLRYCSKLETIASGVICKLALLEDLRIGESFMKWKQLQGSNNNSSADETYEAEVASLEEFKNLQNLMNLDIIIPQYAKMFPQDLVLEKLEAFTIVLGNTFCFPSDENSSRTLRVTVDESLGVLQLNDEFIVALMTIAETLRLEQLNGSTTVSELHPKGFPELKHLRVQYGVNIQYILKKSCNSCVVLPKLESLHLDGLERLENICDDHHSLSLSVPVAVESLKKLKSIRVCDCKLLKDLFSSNLVKGLLYLEEIDVSTCRSIQTIIVSRETEDLETIVFSQLRTLSLWYLPRLISFYCCSTPNPVLYSPQKGDQRQELASNETIEENQELTSPAPDLFDKKVVFPKLEVLSLRGIKVEKIWDDQLANALERTHHWFQNLTILRVWRCNNLSYLFTSSMVKSIAQLNMLSITNCKSMEKIVATEGEIVEELMLLFPKLEDLELAYLPKLKRFCQHVKLLECQSLRELRLRFCPELKTFISTDESSPDLEEANSSTLFGEKIVFPKLEVLQLASIKVDKIWDYQFAISPEKTYWFQNLTTLEVSSCDNLSHLFASIMAEGLAQLEKFEVRRCMSMEEIIATKGEMVGEISFPKLDKLVLEDLPKLKRFCYTNLLKCQSLQELQIDECSQLKAFISIDESSHPGQQEANSSTLFDEKVEVPNLKKLTICNMDQLKMIWGNQLHPNSFSKLKILRIQKGRDLLNVFPPSMWRRALNVKILYIDGCASLEKVFDVQMPMNERETLPFHNLRLCLF